MKYKNLTSRFVFLFFPAIVFSQNIQKKIQLDTILHTGYKLENTFEKVPCCVADNKVWFNVPSWRDNDDSVMLVRYDLSTCKCDTLYGILPDISEKIKVPTPRALAADKNYCVITFFGAIAIFEINGKKLSFNKIFPINENFTYVKLQGDLLICGKVYDSHPLDDPNKTTLAVYDIKKDKFTHYLNPEFKNVAFSHFDGYHWVDASESKILFAQTTEYTIDVYDQKLGKQTEIKRAVPGWNQFDSKIMDRFNKEIPPQFAKILIDSLTPFENTVSRVEGAYFINDSAILVKYIPAESFKKNNERMFDMWVYKNNNWQLKFSDLQDVKYGLSDKVLKTNFPVSSGSQAIYVSKDKVALITPGTTIYPIGKTGNELKKMADDYYISNNPVANISIFSVLK